MHRRIALLTLALTLSGCATPIPKDAKTFSGLATPEPGKALLYVIRPPFEEHHKRQAPLLSVGTTPVAAIAHGSFTHFNLSPGKHILSVKAGMTDSNAWNKSIEITVEPSKTYFLAMWMNMDVARTLTLIPIPGAFLPLGSNSPRATGLAHEFVTEAQALEALEGLTYIPPASSHH